MNEHAEVPRQVYVAIHHVMEDLAKSGVGKNKTNTQQNFAYRGVDDVMDALAPCLARHGLIIVPHVMAHQVTERESRAGAKLFHTLLQINYDFICVQDGSKELVGPIYGEAMDLGDKATNKAMATAYKYAVVQTFCIPITGDDPDAVTHEIAPRDAPALTRKQAEALTLAASGTKAANDPYFNPPRKAERPEALRPAGIFGYGKKYYDVPWNVMKGADLEWFLNAERTPQVIRERIVAELAWRENETAQLEAGIARDRAQNTAPLSDDIP
jgi:hypothetical protein